MVFAGDIDYLADMFTGIIETMGQVEAAMIKGSNKSFWISSPLSQELKIDQSVSHDGVCLTVEALKDGAHYVTAVEETLIKSNLGNRRPGDDINLERCMQMNGRIDGHMVQGHVDATATCIDKKDMNGSWEFSFEFAEKFAALMIEKGSVAVNGISLTAYNVGKNSFTVAIIPYTFHHTNLKNLQPADIVNIEFDMIGKYIQRMLQVSPDGK